MNRPMRPITSKVENAKLMLDIFIYLHSIDENSHDEKYACNRKSYQEVNYRELIRYNVADNCQPHHKLAYIITILGNVVYLFFIQHNAIVIAMNMPRY